MGFSLYISAFLFAFAGSVHCLSMCTPILGIVGINSELKRSEMAIFYNLGRLLTYVLLGALFGLLGSVMQNYLSEIKYFQNILKYLAAFIMFLFALSLLGLPKAIAHLERIANFLWRYVAPHAKKVLPIRSRKSALLGGMIWGLLPCGLVYAGGLGVSLGSGSLISGAMVMFAFGLGTLPSMMSAAFGIAWLTKYMQYKSSKVIAGLVMIIMIAIYLSGIIKMGHSSSNHDMHNMQQMNHQTTQEENVQNNTAANLHSNVHMPNEQSKVIPPNHDANSNQN